MSWRNSIDDHCALTPTQLLDYFKGEAYTYIGVENPEIARAKRLKQKKKKDAGQIVLDDAIPAAPPPPLLLPWDSGRGTVLHIFGESEIIVEWMDGNRKNHVPHCQDCIGQLMTTLETGWRYGLDRAERLIRSSLTSTRSTTQLQTRLLLWAWHDPWRQS